MKEMDNMPIDQNDLMGNFVDGLYWSLLEEALLEEAKTLKGKPRAILDRLVATVGAVPPQLMQEQQEFWNYVDDDSEDIWAKLERIHAEMIEDIVRGEYAPESATLFVMEFIRRVTGAKAS
jgi:5-methylthioribose kinase